MKYKLIIDILDNNRISEEISTQLYNRLLVNNLDVSLLENSLSTQAKINEINQYGENTIVISNQMNNANTSEIIYSLYYDNVLPLLIDNELTDILNVAKFYQLRSPSDTSQDYYEIIRETPLAESIIIRYENISENLIPQIVEALYQAINDYILKENIYIVQSGDTLYSIARKFNVTVAEITNANNLSGSTLAIGQELIIPAKKEEEDEEEVTPPSSPYETYVVVSGDSLYKIANQFNTTVDEIKQLNNLTTNTLSIGQILKIPNLVNENYQTYTVVAGDSLYKIANRFNTTVNALIELNNLTSSALSIGQTLLIPKTTSYLTYTVVSGDSLYKIANRFNTTVNEIINLNNLTSSTLSIGQILLIPQTTPYQQYTVVAGDSLYKIANRFNTTVNELINLNNLTSNTLSIGQTLLIPD